MHARLICLAFVMSMTSGSAGCFDLHDRDDRRPFYDPASRNVRWRTYYVTAAGDDERSGQSLSQAWRSLDRVSQETLEPGDRVLLEGGTVFDGTLTLQLRDGGKARTPVQISSFGTSRAIIDAGEGDGIVIADLSGVIVQHLIVRGRWNAQTQTGNDGEGVRAVGTQSGQHHVYLRLQDLDISGFKRAGIALHATPEDESKDSGYEDVEISDCQVHDNGDVGVVSDGPYIYDGPGYSHFDVKVRRTLVHHNRGLRGKPEHTGSGIVLSDVSFGIIEDCVAHDNGDFNENMSGGGYGIWAWDSDRVYIQYNEAYANRTATVDGGGFDLDGGMTRSALRYNYSHDNQGAGYGAFQFEWARPFSDNQIYENISQNDGFGFLVWDGNDDMGALDVLQNVSYGDKPALMTYSDFEDVAFVNNIFIANGPVLADVFAEAGLTLQGNVYWTGETAFALRWNTDSADATKTFADLQAFQDATDQEAFDGAATGSQQDPLLIAPGTAPTLGDLSDATLLPSLTMYQLRDDSPLIDHGVNPRDFGVTPVDLDFYGGRAPLGAAFEPGIHELR